MDPKSDNPISMDLLLAAYNNLLKDRNIDGIIHGTTTSSCDGIILVGSTASPCDMQADVISSSDIESNLKVTSISTSESNKEINMSMTFISLDALKQYV